MKEETILKHRRLRKRKLTTKMYKAICRKYKNSKLRTVCRFCGGQRELGWNMIFCYCFSEEADNGKCGCFCTCNK